MRFITAIYFTKDKTKKVMCVENPHASYIEASEYSIKMAHELAPKTAKDVRARTYEIGGVNYALS